MRPIVTLTGIDEAINNLGYTNERHVKTRVIKAIRQYYSDENSIRTVTHINTDDLIRLVWDTDTGSEAVKNRRKNFSSIKSSINADLTSLHDEGKNPEGITIGRKNTFDMSDKAKNELLENFSGGSDGDSLIPLGKINDVLGIINDLLKKDKTGTGIDSEDNRNSFKQLKDLIQSISQRIDMPYNTHADSKEIDMQAEEGIAEDIEVIEAYEDIEKSDIEEIPEDELEEVEWLEDADEIDLSEDIEVVDELPSEEEIAEDLEVVEEDEDLDDMDVEEVPEDELEEVEDIEDAEDIDEVEELEEADELAPEEEIADDIEIIEEDEDLDDTDVEEAPEDELEEVEDIEDAEDIDEVEELEEADELAPEEEIADDIEIVEEDEDLDDTDVEEVPEDELEEVEDIEDAEDIDEAEIEEIDQERLLADEFNNMLSEMDRYYNQYILIPKGRYSVGGKDLRRNHRAADTVDIKEFSFGKFPVTNALFEIFIEKTGYVTTAERIGHGTVYYGRYQNIMDNKTGLKTLNWNSAVETRVIEGACWFQPTGPGSTLHGKRNHPVVQVSLEDAMAFAKWTGKRIPTEVQWEAASRTMKGYRYPWAREYRKGCCNIEDSYIGDTTPVDKYPDSENSLGIMDTLGNIMEWTVDTHRPSADKGQGHLYIVKGGSWISGNEISLYDRSFSEPDSVSNILGFRCIAY